MYFKYHFTVLVTMGSFLFRDPSQKVGKRENDIERTRKLNILKETAAVGLKVPKCTN